MKAHQPQREIRTSQLLLRAAKPEDAADLHECFSDPEVMRYWSTLPHTTSLETQKWVKSMAVNKTNGVSDFLIVSTSNSIVIGKIGIWSGNEIGFMLARSQWRKGLVSEALEAVLPYFFDELEYESIVADADPRNEASVGILKKFRFEENGYRERTFEVGGVWVDSLDLALTRDAWNRSRTTS
jgi:ribosomal-protein-alanine N-acetyltransferase